MRTGKLVVGVTGASGAIYAQKFVREAARACDHVYLVISTNAVDVARTELGTEIDKKRFSTLQWLGEDFRNVHLLDDKDFFTPPASGSFLHDGMVVVPCSMGTAARIANGISDNLLTRCADVCLKEKRPLVLVPREMPWNLIMLRNLTAVCEAGATVLPACPAWYTSPQSLSDLADTVVARIMQAVGLEQSFIPEWQAE
ncbi:MAG: UbiX family flavin prenyltransferase [Chthonomonadaceae bacterium]|nr:UbiX family flavin prenyltransferase [Chthonomonadaceae bacterium]